MEDLKNQVRRHSVVPIEGSDSQETDTEHSGQLPPESPLEQVGSALPMMSSERTSSGSFSSESSLDVMDPSYSNQTARAPGSMSAYRGSTTGVEVVRGLRDLCDTLAGFSMHSESPSWTIADALDVEAPAFQKLSTVSSAGLFFFPGPSTRRWIDLAFSEAFILWPFIDRESFEDQVRRMIETGSSGEVGWDRDRIGLLHAVIALGQRHDPDMISIEGNRSQSQETRGRVPLNL